MDYYVFGHLTTSFFDNTLFFRLLPCARPLACLVRGLSDGSLSGLYVLRGKFKFRFDL